MSAWPPRARGLPPRLTCACAGRASPLYTLTLARNFKRMAAGGALTDFARVEGLPGVMLANQLESGVLEQYAEAYRHPDYEQFVQTKVPGPAPGAGWLRAAASAWAMGGPLVGSCTAQWQPPQLGWRWGLHAARTRPRCHGDPGLRRVDCRSPSMAGRTGSTCRRRAATGTPAAIGVRQGRQSASCTCTGPPAGMLGQVSPPPPPPPPKKQEYCYTSLLLEVPAATNTLAALASCQAGPSAGCTCMVPAAEIGQPPLSVLLL